MSEPAGSGDEARTSSSSAQGGSAQGGSAQGGARRSTRLLWVLLVVIVGLGVVTARAVLSGEAEIAASTEALKRGDPHDATVRARRAAGWYVPGAPHVRVAYARLVALAEAAEDNRRRDIALLAWRGVRSASLQTRWLLTPHAADAARAEREIARLAALPDKSTQPDPAQLQQQLRALAPRPGPSRLWGAAAVAAFVLGAAGLLWWSRRVSAAAGKLDWTRARGPLVMSLLAVALWLLALWQA